jgi:L-amino acid N-acyltransferase YncA
MDSGALDFLSTYPYLSNGQFTLEYIQEILVRDYADYIEKNKSDFVRIWNQGIIHCRRLDWDTGHFKVSMGMIDHFFFTDSVQAIDFYDELTYWTTSNGIRHLSARLNVENASAINFLFQRGFELITSKFLLRHQGSDLKNTVASIAGLNVYRATKVLDIDVLLRIAHQSFTENRFYKDSYLDKEKSLSVYREWVRSFIKNNPEDVYLASVEGRIVGFCLANKRLVSPSYSFGFVSLIAVDRAFVGRQVGKRLVAFVLDEFRSEGIYVTHANVVHSNVSSLLLFQSLGFKVYSQLLEARKIID